MRQMTLWFVALAILATIVGAKDKDMKSKSLIDYLIQKPIFYAGEMRRTDRELGDPCQFSSDCSSGCCLKEKGGRRRCSRKMKKDEPCSVSQVKLDLYMNYCPCEKGNRYCSNDPEPRCTA